VAEVALDRRRRWRALAVLPLPFLVALWALWRELYTLDAAGLVRSGAGRAAAEWGLASLATLALAACFWAGSRVLRLLGYTLWSLLLSFAFGEAGVLGVMHAFGGPHGDRDAPVWVLVLLAVAASLSVFALLATAGLLVEDVKAADERPRG
jgi:hypothetical protein